MAEIKEGILGGIHGKLGPVVGYVWRGRYFLRSAPQRSTKKATPAQQLQQDKMGLVATFTSKIKHFVNQHYPPTLLNNKVATGKEQLSSLLMKQGIVIIDNAPCIDLQTVLVSIGTLPPAVIKSFKKLKNGNLKVSWCKKLLNILAKNSDQLTLIAYNDLTDVFSEIPAIGKRIDESAHFSLPADWKQGNIHFWSVWKSVESNLISTSAYHGNISID